MFGDNGILQQRQFLVHLSCAISHINVIAGTKAILRRWQSSRAVGLISLVGLWCGLVGFLWGFVGTWGIV